MTMADVLAHSELTRLDVPPERVLEGASEADLAEVVICGWDHDGEFYFASSQGNGGDTLWLLAMAQKKLLDMGEA